MGTQELLIILGILLLLFGAKKLPELSNSIGKSIREFRRGQEEGSEESDATSQDASTEES